MLQDGGMWNVSVKIVNTAPGHLLVCPVCVVGGGPAGGPPGPTSVPCAVVGGLGPWGDPSSDGKHWTTRLVRCSNKPAKEPKACLPRRARGGGSRSEKAGKEGRGWKIGVHQRLLCCPHQVPWTAPSPGVDMPVT